MISVIIPALNEEKNIGRCIDSIRAEDCECEIIVSDGGSSDRTREIAAGYAGVKVIVSAQGRGAQMNAGVSWAVGNIFLFLHADTALERGWSRRLLSAAEDDSVAGGAFTFSIDHHAPKYRLVEAWVRMRCFVLSLPYGDQGIFMKKESFDDLSGYRNIPLMEDVDLVERMKKLGRIVILDSRAVTSPRRWEKKGVIRTAFSNHLTMLRYRLGADPRELVKRYYR
jgi:rSAM/selenodomain-associated transferase 2